MEAKTKPPSVSSSEAITTQHYVYRKVSTTNQDQQHQQPPSLQVNTHGLESATAFETRISEFIKKNTLQSSIMRIRQDATHDLVRRKADRRARKEKESGGASTIVEPPPAAADQQQQAQFEKLSNLTLSEQTAWLNNIHDDAMLMNPHQWIKLASLFNVNSKVSRQQSLLNISHLDIVLQDRGLMKDQDVLAMESYLELRDIQNRNYARDAVAEGVKFIKQNRIKEAMEFYKRALDMDPKYAEGWFHVAEGLVQQRKLQDAEHNLDRVLKLDPAHEGAKALLASIKRTIKPKKIEKGDKWDMVDERGEAMVVDDKNLSSSSSKRAEGDEKKSIRKRSRSPRRKRSKSPSRRRSRSPVTKRRRSRSPARRRDVSRDRSSRRTSKRDNDDRRSRRSRSRSTSPSRHRQSRRENDKSIDDKSTRRKRSRSREGGKKTISRRDDDKKRLYDESTTRRKDHDRSSRRSNRDRTGRRSSRDRHRSSRRSSKDRGSNDDGKSDRKNRNVGDRHEEKKSSDNKKDTDNKDKLDTQNKDTSDNSSKKDDVKKNGKEEVNGFSSRNGSINDTNTKKFLSSSSAAAAAAATKEK